MDSPETTQEPLKINESIVHDNQCFELLILSEAGKPIYSFSKRDDTVTLMPLCSAMFNYAQKTQKETLKTIQTSDGQTINFVSRPPLIIIVIHKAHSFVDASVLVEQVEAQVISILTARTLKSVFEERSTFDLKKLLYGSEKLIDSVATLSTQMTKFEWPCVQAFLAVTPICSKLTGVIAPSSSTLLRPHKVLVPIVSMASNMRDTFHNILSSVISNNSKNIVFSLIFRSDSDKDDGGESPSPRQNSGTSVERDKESEFPKEVSFKLVTICNHYDKHKLKISDIHLILALLNGSRIQLSSSESLWMPVCLPRFNQDAFSHFYISYITDMRNCLVMVSINREEFPNCQRARDNIEERLNALYREPSQRSKILYQLSPLVHPILLELQQKLVSNSLTESELAEALQQTQIYNPKLELYHARQLQFLWYQTSKHVLWWQRSCKSISSVIFYVMRKMVQSSLKTLWLKLSDNSIFLGWHVPTFQLYAQFDNTTTTNEATEIIQRITTWVKKEEDNFTIKEYK